MIIKTDLNRLSDLSAKLKRLERDISDYGNSASKVARNTAQNTKYQYYSNSRVNKACNSVFNAINSLEKSIRTVENELSYQSRIIGNAVGSYKSADTIEKVNKSAVSYVGPHLGGVFGFVSSANYLSKIDGKRLMKTLRFDSSLVRDKSSSNQVIFDSPVSYFDAKGLYKGLKSSAQNTYKAYKAGFFSSGFDVKQVGDYVRVYGKNKSWTTLKDFDVSKVKGRRYKVGSELDVYSGTSSYASNVSVGTRLSRGLKSNFKNFGKDTFGSWGSLISYAGIVVETYNNVGENRKRGASVSKIAADATTDVAKGLGSMAAAAVGAKAGAALGTLIPVPVVGTVVGAAVGAAGGVVASFAYDYVIDGGIKIGGKSIAGWVSTGLETAYSAVGDATKKGVKAVSKATKNVVNAAKSVVNSAKNAVESAAKSVGDAVNSAAKGVKNFFKKIF